MREWNCCCLDSACDSGELAAGDYARTAGCGYLQLLYPSGVRSARLPRLLRMFRKNPRLPPNRPRVRFPRSGAIGERSPLGIVHHFVEYPVRFALGLGGGNQWRKGVHNLAHSREAE